MPQPRRHSVSELTPAFAALRRRVGVEDEPPPEAIAHAVAVAARGPRIGADVEHSELPWWSIDPDGSRDLDQALFLEGHGSGWVLHYAIADVAAWVDPGDPVDRAAQNRGSTVYCPDRRAPLHPTQLSEGAASLLDDGVARPAVVWRIALDQRGDVVDAAAARALIRNTRARTYREVQSDLDRGRPDDQTRLLVEVGRVRQERESARGGVSLQLPEQNVVRRGADFDLVYESSLEVEEYNAQLSLCTGITAAALMVDAGFGFLRTLPPADATVIAGLRDQAAALGFEWSPEQPYPAFIRTVDASTAKGAALVSIAARTLRGAGYLGFDGNLPAEHIHAAVAAPYAHVTAPLRRLADRAATECAVAAATGQRPPPWALEAIADLPAVMSQAARRASAVERGVIDICEAAVLAHRLGASFEGRVLSVSRTAATIQLDDPAVIASMDPAGLTPGQQLRLTLVEVDVAEGRVRFQRG